MPATQPHFLSYVIAAVVVFAVYRRIRRNFGKQPLRPARMRIRIILLAGIAMSLVPAALNSRWVLLGELSGLCIGLALGVWGAQRTRFVVHDGELHYVPHTYTGIAVTALFVGRLVYRMVSLYLSHPLPGGGDGFDRTQGFAPSSMVRSPITAAIFFVLVGYYVVYYSVLLYTSRHLTPENIEPATNAVP